MGGGDAGGQVGGPWAGGGKAHPYLARGPGIAVGCVRGPLLVGGEDMADLILIAVKLVVDVENGAAGIAEDGIHPLLQQAL